MAPRAGSDDDRPLLVYDGECAFCRRAVRWLRAITGDRVRAEPFQVSADPRVDRAACARAVHVYEREGGVYAGADACFRALRARPLTAPCWWLYRAIPGLARLARRVYRAVARRRSCGAGGPPR